MHKISKEMAEKEFDRFLEAMGLEFDESSMDPDDAKSFQAPKKLIINAIERGSLVVDEGGQPVYTPQRVGEGKPIVFYEPTGASLMAMDNGKKSEDIKRLYHVMADITHRDAKAFSSMKMADLKICMAITTLFLA